MRYRAKRDFVFVTPENKKVLIAKGDKVFVQQAGTNWEVYSFYARDCIASLSQEELILLFGPEEEFQKPLRDDRFRGRNFGRNLLMIFIILLPLASMTQNKPVTWSWRAVRVDSNYFEFHLTADIFRGWFLYKANMGEKCPYSPLITFENSLYVKPIGKVDVIEAMYCDNNTEGLTSFLCPIPRYTTSVTYVQVFKMPIEKFGIVRGRIISHAMSQYLYEGPTTTDFELKIGEENPQSVKLVGCSGNAKIITTYPKGIFRKTWWFIRHPFGPSYIKKSFYP